MIVNIPRSERFLCSILRHQLSYYRIPKFEEPDQTVVKFHRTYSNVITKCAYHLKYSESNNSMFVTIPMCPCNLTLNTCYSIYVQSVSKKQRYWFCKSVYMSFNQKYMVYRSLLNSFLEKLYISGCGSLTSGNIAWILLPKLLLVDQLRCFGRCPQFHNDVL